MLWFAAITRPQFGESLDLTHFADYNVAALYSVFLLLPVFLLKQHFFFFMFQVLQFWYGYFTLMNRLYNQAFVELKTKKAMCYIFATSVWILLTCYHVSFFFFFLHWVDCLTPTDTLDLPSMHRELFWNMNHVGAQNHVDNQHLLVTFRFISSICIYCLVSCEQYCLMSTELSVIVCVAICNLE